MITINPRYVSVRSIRWMEKYVEEMCVKRMGVFFSGTDFGFFRVQSRLVDGYADRSYHFLLGK